MYRYRSIFAVLLAAVLCLLSLSACGGKDAPQESRSPSSSSAPASREGASGAEEQQSVPILGEFTAADLDGNEVTQAVFEGHPVTMVNVWATFCGPCLGEMPDLGTLHDEYSEEGFQIVGIVTDVQEQDGSLSQSQVELAKQIAEETGADYLHLVPSEDLYSRLLWQVNSVPTTIFVDETGALIGKGYLGSRSADQWRKVIEEKLAAIKDEEAAS